MDFYMIKTTAGLALDQKLPNSELTLKLTKAMSGAGKVEQAQLAALTSVSEPVQTLELKDLIHPVSGSENTTLTIPVFLSNAGLETGYELFQVGVYAQDPDVGEILYLVAQLTRDTGEPVPSEGDAPGFSIDFNLAVNVANADKVEVVLNEAGKLTVEQADQRYAKKEDLANIPGLELYVGRTRPTSNNPWIWFDGIPKAEEAKFFTLNLSEGNDADVQAKVDQKDYNVENGTLSEDRLKEGEIFVDVIN